MDNQQQPRTYTRPEWLTVKEFKDEAAGLCVQVQKSGTRFSTDLGGLKDGEFIRHIKPRITGEGKDATVATFGMVAARLLDEAALFIQGEVQKQRPRPKGGEGGQRGVGGGLSRFSGDKSKTEREAAKRARHEQNLAARQAADQERTRHAKSK